MHHRPYSLAAPGRPSLDLAFTASPEAEGARNAGVPGDPRTSTPRDIEAGRVKVTASPPSLRRPARDVYRFAPLRPRWTSRFRRRAFRQERLSTAAGPDEAANTL